LLRNQKKVAPFSCGGMQPLIMGLDTVSPMIWVPNQLVGAPAGTNVTIDCHTEAYPRAISYWVYENVMILPTKKYGTETTENSYRAHMKLTIRDLRDRDFGNYRCISKNSLGETEGSIRLYEIPMPSSPPKATEVRSSGASKEEKPVLGRNATKVLAVDDHTKASSATSEMKRDHSDRLTPPPDHPPQGGSESVTYFRLYLTTMRMR
ncbi:hypothetical protein L9F63_022406, partial [Diploptera punctata]